MARLTILLKISLLLVLGSALLVEAIPQDNPAAPHQHHHPQHPTNRDRGPCQSVWSDRRYQLRCVPNSGLTCDTMPGQTQRICVTTSPLGGPCNNQFTKCATGLSCNIPFGQWAGTCISGTSPPPTPPPVTVGLANPCGIIGGTNFVCVPNSGLTCDTMPGQTQRICLRISQQGGTCNNQLQSVPLV
ncbi:hypothetical protein BDF22DRAFT_652298 [Syncephalis plumigaleata]|nr:hypothetical protein BDF22DRAFT_652298 [Syncephalis plumigaleata]